MTRPVLLPNYKGDYTTPRVMQSGTSDRLRKMSTKLSNAETQFTVCSLEYLLLQYAVKRVDGNQGDDVC